MAKLSSDGKYVVVEKGDTLWAIAKTYGKGKTYQQLAKINDIDNPNLITPGQKIYLSDGDAPKSSTKVQSKVTIKQFGPQSNAEGTLFVTWNFSRSNTKEYRTIWYYYTGDGVWFEGQDNADTNKYSIYNYPSNAKKVRVKVLPIATTTKDKKGKEVARWKGEWCSYKTYTVVQEPEAPGTPKVEIDGYKLTVSLENLTLDNATHIQFKIVKNDKTLYKTANVKIQYPVSGGAGYASYTCNIDLGSEYSACCRSYKGKLYSKYSDYCESVGTQPAAPKEIITIKVLSPDNKDDPPTKVQLDWSNVKNADTYRIQYTTSKMYFDSDTSGEVKDLTVDGTLVGHAEVEVETGKRYYFRVRAENENGDSAWTPVKSIVVGAEPEAPTAWSSVTTAMVGNPVYLYWTHNSEDDSDQTKAQIRIITSDDDVYDYKTVSDDKTEYKLETKSYSEGTKVRWGVRTAGITGEWSDWSETNIINIYAPPTAYFSTAFDETLTSYPLVFDVSCGPWTQTCIDWHISITSTEAYDIDDNLGRQKTVRTGEVIYSKHFSPQKTVYNDGTVDYNIAMFQLTPGDVTLKNNVTYKLTVSAAMNSGLVGTVSEEFTVAWSDDGELDEPNAAIEIITEDVTAAISPFCRDINDDLVVNTLLSVYRREYDGEFTELATNIPNNGCTWIVDPHPALDGARYRIVAISQTTGAISYYDTPGEPIEETAVIIQWDESWSDYELEFEDSDELAARNWSGSMLKLPYNIDVSDSHSPDVSFIEYIGRTHPVSYYGTQRGKTATWNVEIDKNDDETLSMIRRLANWMGDCYVREPSGSGYYANVKVSYNQKHLGVTIPITFDITRVDVDELSIKQSN